MKTKHCIQREDATCSLFCAGCYDRYEIPRSVQGDPYKLTVMIEALEQRHRAQGCLEAAERVEQYRFTPQQATLAATRKTALEIAKQVLSGNAPPEVA